MITLKDYWMGRDTKYPQEFTPTVQANAVVTVEKANALIAVFQSQSGAAWTQRVTSGWRPSAVNSAIPNAAQKSRHMTAEAIDLHDPEGEFDAWALARPETLAEIGLWQEHPSSTHGWIHLQIVPPKSGKRVFCP